MSHTYTHLVAARDACWRRRSFRCTANQTTPQAVSGRDGVSQISLTADTVENLSDVGWAIDLVSLLATQSVTGGFRSFLIFEKTYHSQITTTTSRIDKRGILNWSTRSCDGKNPPPLSRERNDNTHILFHSCFVSLVSAMHWVCLRRR